LELPGLFEAKPLMVAFPEEFFPTWAA